MEELQDLVRIISKERLKTIDILNNPDAHKDGRSRVSRFYHGVLSKKITDDKTARKELGYEDNDRRNGYTIFKSRFRKTLYNSLFFISMPGKDLSDYDRLANECSRAQHQGRILIWFYARKSAISFCESMLAKAEAYELTEFSVFFLRKLLQKTAMAGKKHDFYKYSEKLKRLLPLWEAEEKAALTYFTMHIAYARTIVPQPLVAQTALKAAKKIIAGFTKQDSYLLRYYAYRMQGIALGDLGMFSESNEAWEALEQYFIDNPKYSSNAKKGEIAVQQMGNHLLLGYDASAYECAERCFKYFGKSSINKMVFYENYILLLMHKGRYNEAAKIFQSSYYEIPWKEMTAFHQERWKLVQAWLYLVSKKDYEANIIEEFRFARTINEMRTAATDKNGLNKSLQILEIVWYLKEKNDKKLYESMTALKSYKTKYIRKGITKRTQILIRMLLILEECNYNPAKAKTAAAQWQNKLHASPYTFPGEYEGFEVILFEDVWEIMLGFIKRY